MNFFTLNLKPTLAHWSECGDEFFHTQSQTQTGPIGGKRETLWGNKKKASLKSINDTPLAHKGL